MSTLIYNGIPTYYSLLYVFNIWIIFHMYIMSVETFSLAKDTNHTTDMMVYTENDYGFSDPITIQSTYF